MTLRPQTNIPQNKRSLLALEFKSEMRVFSEMLERYGLNISVDSQRAWQYFATLNSGQQQDMLERFQRYFSVVTDITDQGIQFNDTYQSLWRIFKKNDWMLEGDLLSRIKSTNVVEIYLADNTQFYRNANYFKYTSYSLPELMFFPWNELVEHGPSFEREIGEAAKKIFLDNVDPRTTFTLTPYIAKERYSSRRYEALLTSEFLCPVRSRSTKRNEAALVVWDIEILRSANSNENLTRGSEYNEKTI